MRLDVVQSRILQRSGHFTSSGSYYGDRADQSRKCERQTVTNSAENKQRLAQLFERILANKLVAALVFGRTRVRVPDELDGYEVSSGLERFDDRQSISELVTAE